jgi:hypothetical protein
VQLKENQILTDIPRASSTTAREANWVGFCKKTLPWVCGTLLLLQCVHFAWDNGQTVDETFYNGSGYPMVRYNNYGSLGEHPPLVMQLGSLPLLFLQPNFPINDPIYIGDSKEMDLSKMGARFLYEMGNNPQLILFLERLTTVMLVLLGAVILFRWGYSLFGWGGAMLTLTLYSFSPNIVTHGSQYTTDFAITVFFLLSLYRIYRFFETPTIRNAIWIGLSCGFALMSKMSAILLFPISIVLLLGLPFLVREATRITPTETERLDQFLIGAAIALMVCSLPQKLMFVAIAPICIATISLLWKGEKFPKLFITPSYVKVGLIGFGVILGSFFIYAIAVKRDFLISISAATWIFMVASFAWYLSKTPHLSLARYMSKIFALVWFVAMFVVIVGYTDFYRSLLELDPFHHYIRAFNIASHHSIVGHGSCIPGSSISCDWTYFAAAMLIKTPTLTILLIGLGLIAFIKSNTPKVNQAVIIIPVIVYFLFASFVNQIYLGVRHVLPIYPLLFLVAGACVPFFLKLKSSSLRGVVSVFFIFSISMFIAGSLQASPHQFSYFNEFVGGAEKGVNLMQVNVGQDNRRLAKWVHEHNIEAIHVGSSAQNQPEFEYYGIPAEVMWEANYIDPPPGYYALDFETYRDQQFFVENSWFRGKQPNHKVGSVFYIFEIEDGRQVPVVK